MSETENGCNCAKCRRRRGESICDPPLQEPSDPAGTSTRLLGGVTDLIEQAIIGSVSNPIVSALISGVHPTSDLPTRAWTLESAAKLVAARRGAPPDPQAAEHALDALIACGFIVEENGELRITNLAEMAAKAGRGE